ncbi:uncharacterized protein N7498_003148 [Penicillium cinerascens]|uniref:Chromo domain-containing protein n=1 Tax=Penicillium cinerascens TaxID=70096 RepID=A0A9W9T6M7_9EURO|nr:uncharacterized protein N7498_003148 [Penicillium cinerascens]KAJ5211502.1 hypothetical protein N7498_003148 [Penicillium cinerascens]
MASYTAMEDAGELSEPDSLVSTAESEPQEEYEVEAILAENEERGEYLVKWAGYPNHRATWEGPESFDNLDDTMKDWKQTKWEISEGLRSPFNVRQWQREQNRLAREKEARQRTRKIKRAQRARRKVARLNRPDPNLAATLFGDDEGSSNPAIHSSATRRSSPEQDMSLEGNFDEKDASGERGVSLNLDIEDAVDALAERTSSRRSPSVTSAKSDSSSLFVSEVKTPPLNNPRKKRSLEHRDTALFVPSHSEQSTIQYEEAETHELQLQQELEQGLGQQHSPRARQSQSEKQQGTEQHELEPLERHQPPQLQQPPQPPCQQEPGQQKQTQEKPRSQHHEKPLQRQAQQTHLPSKPTSAPAPPPPTRSVPAPAPSSFGVAPRPTQTARPRRSRWAEREPNVTELELRKPSQYRARGEGADSATLSMLRPSAEFQPLSDPGNRPKEPPTTTSSSTPAAPLSLPHAITDRFSDMSPTSVARPRVGNSGALEAERPHMPSSSLIRDVVLVPRSGGESYRPIYPRERSASPDDDYSRRRSDAHPMSYRHGNASWSRSRSRSPPPDLIRSPDTSRRSPYRNRRGTPYPQSPSLHADFHPRQPRRTLPPILARLPPTKAELSAQDYIAKMPIGTYKEGEGVKTKSGYFWNFGEVLAHVYFGPERDFVGVFRICGMNDKIKQDLLASKMPGNTFDMWFKQVCTKSQYDRLCDQTPYNDRCGNAWMEGFPDTNSKLFHTAEYLRLRNSAAIYRPAKSMGSTWVMYSCQTTSFTEELNYNSDRVPANVPAFLAIRPPLPSFLHVEPSPRDESSRGRRDFPKNVHFRDGDPTRHESLGDLPNAKDRAGVNRSAETLEIPKSAEQRTLTRVLESTMSGDLQSSELRMTEQPDSVSAGPRLRRRSSISKSTPQSPTQPRLAEQDRSPKEGINRSHDEDEQIRGGERDSEMTSLEDLITDPLEHVTTTPSTAADSIMVPSPEEATQTMLRIFRDNYKITLEQLSTVSEGTQSQVLSPTPNFYLHSCSNQEGEARKDGEFLEAWLKTFPQINIFSDWKKFLNECPRGVIMFHESFTCYDELRPELRQPLWSSRYIFWNYRLSRPLQTADPFFCDEGAHFQLIFPIGTAFLITEDVFSDLKRALVLICWFYYGMAHSYRMNKLMLHPGIMQYLDRRLDDPELREDDEQLLLLIIGWIQKANSIDPRRPVFQSESLNPRKIHMVNNNIISFEPEIIQNWIREGGSMGVPKDISQDERNADHVVQMFTAWTLLNAACIRKTVVITSTKNRALHTRWLSNGRVVLYSPSSFINSFRIPEDLFLAKALGENPKGGNADNGRLLPAMTPKTPAFDPRTPRAPWTSHTGDGTSSPKEMGRQNYPAPYK